MKIGVLLTTSKEHGNTNTVLDISGAALKDGHEVGIFLMDDGVYNIVKTSESDELYVADKFSDLIKQGVEIALCDQTARERGVNKENSIEGVVFGGQFDLAVLVNESDRFLAFN